MKQVSNSYKENIRKYGKQLDSKITYIQNGSTITLDNTQINSISVGFEGSILKSVMKKLTIDSNVEIPLDTVLAYSFGVYDETNRAYEYINYGNYVVYKIETKEDTNSYEITCYDKLLYAMKDYESLNVTYPISIRDYINALCTKIGLVFKNAEDEFANYDKMIPNELYLNEEGNSIGYTFRDVLDELAQVTASTICITNNDKVEIRYIEEPVADVETIDEHLLKNVNVNFGEKYGPVNSIVLSRADSDNIYLQDEDSVEQNGLCEIKIIDNQIMNGNDRSIYLQDILDKLDGLEYYLNDFSSTGITYLDLCDRYNVQIDEKTYSCVMFNDEINVTQGLEELINTNMPEQSETDYTKADKTDRKINQTTLIVDKHEQEIQALIDKVVDISNIVDGVGSVTLENAFEGILHKIEIIGSISLLFPNTQTHYGRPLLISDDLIVSNDVTISSGVPYQNSATYPSSTTYPINSNLKVDDDTYQLDLDYLNYLSPLVHDKFVYEDGIQWIERNVGIDAQGNMYALEETIIEHRKDLNIFVKENSTLTLESFGNGVLQVEYLLKNKYTSTFATQVYVDSAIKQTADEIELQVREKVNEDEIIAKINLAVENDQGIINLTGNTVTIDSDNFHLDAEGNIQCQDAVIDDAIMHSAIIYDTTLANATIEGGSITLNGGANTERLKIIQTNEPNIVTTFSPSSIEKHNNNASYYVSNGTGTEDHITTSYYIPNSIIYNDNISAEYSVYGMQLVTGSSIVVLIDRDGVRAPAFINTSTEEEKKNIKKLNKALDTIKNTEVYSYNWKNEDTEKKSVKKHYGLVIGKGYKTPKEFIHNDKDGKETGIDIYATLSFCIKAIQEQQEQIEELQKEIELLKEEKNGKDKLSK